MSSIAVPDALTVEVDGRRHLAGARCTACATYSFPVQLACSRCGAATEVVPLPTDGTVWSWTVQRLAPKPPYAVEGEFEPFAVAYVDLGVVKVESKLAGRAAGAWQIGEPVHLAVADGGDPVLVRRGGVMSVSVVGVGLHPFGRFDISGREMGLIAAREALRDAGIDWSDVQFAAGGSRDSGHAAALVSELGLTGVPFIGRLQRLRHRRQRAARSVAGHRGGRGRHRARGRFRQARPRRVRLEPRRLRPARLVRRGRDDGHHAVLRAEDPALPARARPRPAAARRDRREVAAQRVDHAARVASQADVGRRHRRRADGERPAHVVHVLQPERGWGGRGARLHRAGTAAHHEVGRAALDRVPHPPLRHVRGVQPLARSRHHAGRHGRRRALPRSSRRASVRPTSTSPSCRTPRPAPS